MDTSPSHQPEARRQRLLARKAAGICSNCPHPVVPGRALCQAHLDKVRQASAARYAKTTRHWFNARYRRARNAVIAGYGGACVCCGETTPEFLAIDHVNGGGRKAILGGLNGYAYLAKIIRDNYPMEYQLLCHNCNMAKKWGICPHRR